MAFGNYGMGFYPAQQGLYNPMNPAPDMLAQFKTPYQQQAQNQNGFNWVQGEEAAKAFPVAPGSTVILWDTERNAIYVKTADASGLPSMRILDWAEHTETPAKPAEHVCKCGGEFVAKEDFEGLKAEVERLTKRIDGISKSKSKVLKRLEDDDDE